MKAEWPAEQDHPSFLNSLIGLLQGGKIGFSLLPPAEIQFAIAAGKLSNIIR